MLTNLSACLIDKVLHVNVQIFGRSSDPEQLTYLYQ